MFQLHVSAFTVINLQMLKKTHIHFSVLVKVIFAIYCSNRRKKISSLLKILPVNAVKSGNWSQ